MNNIISSALDPVSILKAPKNAINNVFYPEWSKNIILQFQQKHLTH
jgi:hypothetical protein